MNRILLKHNKHIYTAIPRPGGKNCGWSTNIELELYLFLLQLEASINIYLTLGIFNLDFISTIFSNVDNVTIKLKRIKQL